MATSREAGASFIKGLLDDFDNLTEAVKRLDVGLDEERRLRTETAHGVQTQLNVTEQNIAGRVDALRADITKCADDVDAQGRHINDLEVRTKAQSDELAVRISAAEEHFSPLEELARRLTKLEETVALNDKHVLQDVGRLTSSIAGLREEAKRTQASQDASEDRLSKEIVALQKDVNKMAPAVEFSRLATKLESTEAAMQARALSSDLNLLESRMTRAEGSLQAATVEMSKKALNDDVKSASEDVAKQLAHKASQIEVQSFRTTLENLSAEVAKNQVLLKDLENVLSPLPNSVQTLSSCLKTLDRRQDTESERTNSCWVSLEKEIASKVARSEFDMRLTKLEHVAPQVATKASLQDVQSLMTRTEHLESGLSSKADRLALSNEIARHDELQRVFESKIESLGHDLQSCVLNSVEKVSKHQDQFAMEWQGQLNQFQEEVHCQTAYTREEVDQQLLHFYPRQEMDALLARVWWRLGQSGKPCGPWGQIGPTTSTTATSASPERPGSATVRQPDQPRSARPQSAHR